MLSERTSDDDRGNSNDDGEFDQAIDLSVQSIDGVTVREITGVETTNSDENSSGVTNRKSFDEQTFM